MIFFVMTGVALFWTMLFGDFHPKQLPLLHVFYETFFVLMAAHGLASCVVFFL